MKTRKLACQIFKEQGVNKACLVMIGKAATLVSSYCIKMNEGIASNMEWSLGKDIISLLHAYS